MFNNMNIMFIFLDRGPKPHGGTQPRNDPMLETRFAPLNFFLIHKSNIVKNEHPLGWSNLRGQFSAGFPDRIRPGSFP